jgi:hypothetical protein
MIGEAYKCDVCGKQRGEANHWLLLMPLAGMLFALAAWEDRFAKDPDVGHLCGEGCAAKALDRALTPAKGSEEPNG